MRTLGPIIWHFRKLIVAFSWMGEHILLQGLRPTETTVEEGLKFLRSSNKGVMLQLIGEDSTIPIVTTNSLFEEFKGIFEGPQGLPPVRSGDHKDSVK